MDLTTKYLGLELAHPIIAGASPLVDDLGLVQRLGEAGVAAIVMHSLFEEQLRGEALAREVFHETHAHSHAEAQSYFPTSDEFRLGPDEYLEQIGRLKRVVDVPVIASLNGTTEGSWLRYAPSMEQAGAGAIELNLYDVVVDPQLTCQRVEQRAVELVRLVRDHVSIPLAVKLSPFYTALPSFATALAEAGADGLVLFNRFYQADIDVENLDVVRSLRLSDRSELLLRLRWLAILSGRVDIDLSLSGGAHEALDVVKGVMAGAHTVQMVSALLRHGPGRVASVLAGLSEWMEAHEYESVSQMRGSMNLSRCPDPRAFERANYVGILQAWRFDQADA